MASSVKAVLRKKKNSDGKYPLAIRVTIDRKTTYIYLGYSLLESDWDPASQKVKKSHLNSVRLNNLVIQRCAEVSDGLINMQSRSTSTSLKAVRNQLKPSAGPTFFSQANLWISNFQQAGKYNRVKSEQSRLDCFKTFLKDEDIIFPEISVALLNRFRAWLKGTRKVSERTIVNHLLVIRTVYNQAIQAGVADKKNYPFGKDKIVIKYPDSLKIGLTADEVAKIENVDLTDQPYLTHARNVWLLSFYFAGVRISDVLRLKWSDFQGDRLYYAMGKNLKGGSLKIPEKARKILRQYEEDEQKNDLIFPELKVLDDIGDTFNVQRKISFAVKRLNTAMGKVGKKAEVSKPLTMHISRHTFGNISGENIPVQMLQKLYRHSSILTTIGYQANFINKTADDALEKVIGG